MNKNNANEQKLSNEQLNQIINLLASNGIDIDLNSKKEEDWKTQLSTNKFGYLSTIMNYRLWLENGSKRYTNKIKYNSFFDYVEFNNDIIKDIEEDYLYLEAEKFFEHNLSRQNLKTAFNTYANDNTYNPITDYLDSLKDKWDGTPRLETFIIDALEADDNKINRFFSKTWMIAAVKRAYEPGCQFDCILALQGGVQGSGKTSLIRRIALDKYYMNFSAGEFSNKDCIDKMNKSWISVLDEFDKFSDKEVADLKSRITEKNMACRKAYGHNTETYKVHWVYAATTNADDFLCDLTGDEYERRYWIIECKKKTVDSKVNDLLTDEYVNQLWAEAVYCYNQNPNQMLYLDSKNPIFEEYKEYQRKFKKTANNTDIDYINEILDKKYSVDSKGCFKDSIDMWKQFTDNVYYETSQFINRVPLSYVKFILKKVYQVEHSTKYIRSILTQNGNKWELKEQSKYLGKNTRNVLCRTQPIENEALDYSKTNSLPF